MKLGNILSVADLRYVFRRVDYNSPNLNIQGRITRDCFPDYQRKIDTSAKDCLLSKSKRAYAGFLINVQIKELK